MIDLIVQDFEAFSSTLRRRLLIQLDQAEQNPGALVVTRLTNNLRVDILFTLRQPVYISGDLRAHPGRLETRHP